MRATVNVKETADESLIVIEYEDGHTVRISAEPRSLIVRLHLGLADDAGEKEG